MVDRNLPFQGASNGQNGHTDDDDRFLDDPLLPAFFRQKQDDYFALGLVINWRNASVSCTSYNKSNYEHFLSAVETECFHGKQDFLFTLPFHALHITIASLFPALESLQLRLEPTNKPTKASQRHMNGNTVANSLQHRNFSRSQVAAIWKTIILRASQHPEWPKRPLKLELDTAEIRDRAGIFLWKEHTGGIASMRRCLQAAVDDEEEKLAGVLQHLRIPNIIHTTFLRYNEVPQPISCKHIFLRPSEANSVLAKRVIPNQSLFCKTANVDNQMRSKIITASVANLVDCKVYLLDERQQDHDIFLSMPLQNSGD